MKDRDIQVAGNLMPYEVLLAAHPTQIKAARKLIAVGPRFSPTSGNRMFVWECGVCYREEAFWDYMSNARAMALAHVITVHGERL